MIVTGCRNIAYAYHSTGWFIPTAEGPGYLHDVLAPIHALGELKVNGVLKQLTEKRET
jgi:hypothetical protein